MVWVLNRFNDLFWLFGGATAVIRRLGRLRCSFLASKMWWVENVVGIWKV